MNFSPSSISAEANAVKNEISPEAALMKNELNFSLLNISERPKFLGQPEFLIPIYYKASLLGLSSYNLDPSEFRQACEEIIRRIFKSGTVRNYRSDRQIYSFVVDLHGQTIDGRFEQYASPTLAFDLDEDDFEEQISRIDLILSLGTVKAVPLELDKLVHIANEINSSLLENMAVKVKSFLLAGKMKSQIKDYKKFNELSQRQSIRMIDSPTAYTAYLELKANVVSQLEELAKA